ncbi:MAG TPA: glycosyl hydrolase family 28-related protein [Pyrinomonadaceae bacterium]|jgi:hypothetical protein|nr:glycosyl hydrolase family 28-related protein [Pyrinomonadaceae bacterium]
MSKTRIVDYVRDIAGHPLSGKITFILTQQSADVPDGLVVPSPSVSATLDPTGKFDVSLYPATDFSPVSYYQVYVTNGSGNQTFLGLYNIPSSVAIITLGPYKVTDTSLAAQYTFASQSAVLALTSTISATTFASLLSSSTDQKIQKYDSASGGLKDTALTESAPQITSTKKIVAPAFEGSGAGLTGIGTGTGGVINTGSTTIGADSDSDGVGRVSLQTRGVERIGVENNGDITIPGTLSVGSISSSSGSLSLAVHDKGGAAFDIRAYGAVGDGVTDDTVAIRNTLTAANAVGGRLRCPAGRYLYGGGVTETFLFHNAIDIDGDGEDSTVFVRKTSSVAIPSFRYKPDGSTTVTRGFRMSGIGFEDQASGGASHFILDVTGGVILANFRMSDCHFPAGTASYSVAVNNPGPAMDGVFDGLFTNVFFGEGINLTYAGDTLTFIECVFPGTLGIIAQLLVGATTLLFQSCAITAKGGVQIYDGLQITFLNTIIEMDQAGSSGGAGGAVVYIVGGTGTIDNINFENCPISVLAGNTLDGVLIAGNVNMASFERLRFVNPAGKYGVKLSGSNITNTWFNYATNMQRGAGGLLNNLSDSMLTSPMRVIGGSLRIFAASAPPNGLVTGSVGDMCINVNGGAGTVLYVKESGVNTNTGWVGK